MMALECKISQKIINKDRKFCKEDSDENSDLNEDSEDIFR
jgi:hypothetical protein